MMDGNSTIGHERGIAQVTASRAAKSYVHAAGYRKRERIAARLSEVFAQTKLKAARRRCHQDVPGSGPLANGMWMS